ncbi:hypothetical protein HMPREF9412_0571 [Paenibacillus sp. HGF5]|nr:hypothetical protein HMPREF9412_0571 [Paenibacillus sp. HGF5]
MVLLGRLISFFALSLSALLNRNNLAPDSAEVILLLIH